jgi:hypothetical protein
MDNSILDDIIPGDTNNGIKLLESYRYWQSRRLLFNIIVGVAGVISIALTHMFSLLGVIAWGFVANIFYSTGYVLESFTIVRSNGKQNLKDFRSLFFWVGTLGYALSGFIFYVIVFMIGSD